MNGATVSMFVIGAVIALVIALVVGAEIVTQTQSLVQEETLACVSGATSFSSTSPPPAVSGTGALITVTTVVGPLSGATSTSSSARKQGTYGPSVLCTYDITKVATTDTSINTASDADVIALSVGEGGGPLGDTDGTMSLARTVVQFIPVLYFIGLFAIPAAIGFAAYKRFTA